MCRNIQVWAKGEEELRKWRRNGQRGIERTHRKIQEGMITSFDTTVGSNAINLEMSIGFASRNSLVTVTRSISKKVVKTKRSL